MKTLESLFEFMPYGAPELLQSRRERLASASLLASFLVALAILAGGTMARRLAVPPVVVPLPEFKPHDVAPEPLVKPPRPHAALPLVQAKIAHAIPVPVPATQAPPEVGTVAETTIDPGPGTVSGNPDLEVCLCGAQPVDGMMAEPDPDPSIPVEELPNPVTVVRPDYPEVARDAGVEGLVVVKALISKTGVVLKVALDERRQVPLLNGAALDAARQWVFTPAVTNGRPVATWIAIPFHFRLNE